MAKEKRYPGKCTSSTLADLLDPEEGCT